MSMDLNGINYYQIYEPYRSGTNPKFNKATGGLILDLKAGESEAIDYYSSKIFGPGSLPKDILITCAPSSECGISKFVVHLGKLYKIPVRTDIFFKYDGAMKQHSSGIRSMNNIGINDCDLDGIKAIIVFDDVTTTGKTLLTCKKLLQEKNKDKIVLYAIGKTAHY